MRYAVAACQTDFPPAANRRDMLAGIVAVGADAYTAGSKTIGSVLVDRMMVAGH